MKRSEILAQQVQTFENELQSMLGEEHKPAEALQLGLRIVGALRTASMAFRQMENAMDEAAAATSRATTLLLEMRDNPQRGAGNANSN